MTLLIELLIANAIKAAILACLVASIAFLPKVRNLTNLQHSLWVLVLLAMVSPAIWGIPLLSKPGSLGTVSPIGNVPSTDPILPAAPAFENHHASAFVPKVSHPQSPKLNRYLILVATISIVGTVCILIVAFRRVQVVRRTIRLASLADERLIAIANHATELLGIVRPVRVAMVEANTSPFIWIERQVITIVISKSLAHSLHEDRLLSVMLHELSHYRRRDHWANLVGFLVMAICWWNPVSWIAVRRMRELQEYCCDAMAIARSRISRREYAECLYQISSFIESRNTSLPASACELFGRTSVEARFKMIANTRICFESTRSGLIMVLLFSALLPCTIAYAQTEKNAVVSEQEKRAKDDAESKQWHETVERFNRLVAEGDWPKAEQLANETASKFGHEDWLVQNMLLTSINGMRKSQGLAPILIEKLVVDPKSEEVSVVVVYALKDALPPNGADKGKFIEILTQCLSASVANNDPEKPVVKIFYDEQKQGLIIFGTRAQHRLVSGILDRIRLNPKPAK